MSGNEPAKEVPRQKEREAEERRLIEAAQRDPARFGKLYERYFELVYAYIARRVRNRSEAEDLTAEVFRKALQNLPRFKWTGAPFAAWLFRIASNMIADRAKRAAREGTSEPSLMVRLMPLDQSGALLSKATPTQEEQLEQSERSALLFRLVADLAEDQRRVLVMRFAEEKSIREIADALERTEGAVKQLQFRALENLRRMIHHRDAEVTQS
jgi:RNA polymerase sigma-70 factor, ECF subfamily